MESLIILGSFLLGFYIGYRKDKPVIPDIPKIINLKKEEKKTKVEMDRLNTIISNIDSYDGSGKHQKKVGV